jgi:ABC-type amino acid transport substrate-binding protein
MANYIGAKLGVAVELVPVTSANRIPYLQTRRPTWSSRRWARTPSARR